MPSVWQIIHGQVSIQQVKDVELEDLLGREPVRLDWARIASYLQGKRVLVTGAGGSIGSEICRQVARFQPKKLVLFENAETPLFMIERELRAAFPKVPIVPIIGDVRFKARVDAIFDESLPEVVFHAAAYKHVPMLERNPWEAVYNNIIGSRTIMDVSIRHGVERFVLVSTDKAVRPTNVMGASKRVAERIMQLRRGGETRFMAVRFGNVVGSSGSVIPLFRRQIEQGGPVTVTHPEVNRFFMTIPEASQLILQAGAMGEGGEVFILRMGTPVKIADMARDLIRLSGREPDVDVKIVFTGLRPGEKLHEELITQGEDILPTSHEQLMVLRAGASQETATSESAGEWQTDMDLLVDAAARHDAKTIKKHLQRLVPEYRPQENESVL